MIGRRLLKHISETNTSSFYSVLFKNKKLTRLTSEEDGSPLCLLHNMVSRFDHTGSM